MPQLGGRLESLGLTGGELGILLALLPAGRLLSAPVWGWLADRYRLAGLLLRVGALLSLLGIILVAYAVNVMEAGVGLLLVAVGRTPLGPLVDAFVVDVLREAGDAGAYGRIRAWGSVGFLLAALLSGELATRQIDPLLVAVALSAACLALTFEFPARGGHWPAKPAPVGPALRALFGQPGFVALLSFGACQALTVNVYDTFFSVHVRALGLPATVTSYAVFVGVGVEVLVMLNGRWILNRLGGRRALLLAAVSAIPRWLLTAWFQTPLWLILTQALHGMSFALFWIAGVEEVARRSRRAQAPFTQGEPGSRGGAGISASAQSVWAASTYGVGALVGAAFAGPIRGEFGTPAVFAGCALVACVGTAFAWRATVPHGKKGADLVTHAE